MIASQRAGLRNDSRRLLGRCRLSFNPPPMHLLPAETAFVELLDDLELPLDKLLRRKALLQKVRARMPACRAVWPACGPCRNGPPPKS